MIATRIIKGIYMKQYDIYFDQLKKKVPTLQIYMESTRLETHYQYSSTHLNQRFHSASVGKVFCATLVMMAMEEGLLSLESKIHQCLDETLLKDLFVYKNIDYKEHVSIKHLLNHTSGVNDYFEGKTTNHPKFIEQVMTDKDHIFTPYELLDFTRCHQHAIGYPGKRFYYSDTGYVLLGLLLESMYEKPYAEILKEKILIPLSLKDTALCFYDDNFDQKTLAPIIFKGEDMHLANSLSCDFAGGGLQTTSKDLALFLKGLFTEKLIDKSSLDQMKKATHRFHGIMGYGLGMIEIKFHRIIPWMRHYPTLYGGLGSLSVHAFYDDLNHDVYIINLGTPNKMRLSFQILVKMAKWLNPKHL